MRPTHCCALVLAATITTAALAAADGAPYPAAVGAVFQDRPFAPHLVVVPAGLFRMGASEAETAREGRRAETAAWERPQHSVVVPAPLAVGRDLVTRDEYAAFVAATHRPAPSGCMVLDGGTWQAEPRRGFADPAFAQTPTDPAVCVAVEDAEAYVAWLSAATGHRYRLLHEAEWEYAARGGSTTSRWWGDDRTTLCAHLNGGDRRFAALMPAEAAQSASCDDGFAQTNPSGAFPANRFGLHDALGNVWQWTADCFVAGYADAPAIASTPIANGDCGRRVIRGGSWHNAPDSLRSAARFWLPPTMRSSSVGFRVVRMPDGGAP